MLQFRIRSLRASSLYCRVRFHSAAHCHRRRYGSDRALPQLDGTRFRLAVCAGEAGAMHERFVPEISKGYNLIAKHFFWISYLFLFRSCLSQFSNVLLL